MKKINIIIAAAGTSQRYGKENKLFEKCGTSCVLLEAIKPFLEFKEISKIIVATDTTYFDEFMNWLSVLHLDEDNRITAAIGGSSRTQTVKNALNSLQDDCDGVLIHDGARPYVSNDLISRVLDGLKTSPAVIPLLNLTDNISALNGEWVTPLNRENYRLVQTPCGFDKDLIVSAYADCKTDCLDDLSAVFAYSKSPATFVEGDRKNIKITTKSDLKTPLVGCGYDIHRMEEGRGIKLLGTFINCPFSFVAHSDGDVPVHALMDAILSAVGEKDIGHFFPVDDPKYDNADSMTLLSSVLDIAFKKGYSISNAAISIIAEQPILAPYIDEMRARTSDILNIRPERVGITATTNEKIGEIGNCKAIAAYATVLLQPLD